MRPLESCSDTIAALRALCVCLDAAAGRICAAASCSLSSICASRLWTPEDYRMGETVGSHFDLDLQFIGLIIEATQRTGFVLA